MSLPSTTGAKPVKSFSYDEAQKKWVPSNLLGLLVPVQFDAIEITNDDNGEPVTAVYKRSGTVVATLTMTYDDNGHLNSVTKT